MTLRDKFMADPGSECWVEDAHTLPQLHGTKCKSLATELCLSQVFMLTETKCGIPSHKVLLDIFYVHMTVPCCTTGVCEHFECTSYMRKMF